MIGNGAYVLIFEGGERVHPIKKGFVYLLLAPLVSSMFWCILRPSWSLQFESWFLKMIILCLNEIIAKIRSVNFNVDVVIFK